MTISFETMPYELVHGRSPRGKCSWAFCPFHYRNHKDRMDITIWTPVLPYEAAKQLAVEKIKELRSTAPLGSPYLAELWAVMP